jgi:hypothetical protein
MNPGPDSYSMKDLEQHLLSIDIMRSRFEPNGKTGYLPALCSFRAPEIVGL